MLVLCRPRVGLGSLRVSVETVFHSFLCWFFLFGIVIEQVVPGLGVILAPPTGCVRASRRPREVLSGQTVSRFQLVEAVKILMYLHRSQGQQWSNTKMTPGRRMMLARF